MTDKPTPEIKYREASLRGEVIRAVAPIREFRQRAVRSVPEQLHEGLWLEFGSWLGGSAHDIAPAMPHFHQLRRDDPLLARCHSYAKPERPGRLTAQPWLHCFDSWEGLPEDWHDHAAGTFSTAGRLPQLPWNASAHKGWFTETLPRLLRDYPREHWPVAFVHIDCDLYESARFVIATLREAGRLVSGSVVLFDELWGHPGWQGDEYRVLCEELMPYFDCELVAVAPDLKRAAFRLHRREEIITTKNTETTEGKKE